MSRYHDFMLTMNLLASAVTFKMASWFLGRAVHHKTFGARPPTPKTDIVMRYGDNVVNIRAPRVDPADTVGYVTWADENPWQGLPLEADEEEFMRQHMAMHRMFAHRSLTVWTDAEPCSDFDPIHPDYRP